MQPKAYTMMPNLPSRLLLEQAGTAYLPMQPCHGLYLDHIKLPFVNEPVSQDEPR